MKLHAIILAAGKSQRMGLNKMLMPWRGKKNLISFMIDEFAKVVELKKIHVICRNDATSLEQEIQKSTATLHLNPHENSQMLDSIRIVLKTIATQADYIILCPGDQGGIDQSLISSLIENIDDQSSIIVPCSNKKKAGHPIIIHKDLFPNILTQYDDTGLRGLFQNHPTKRIHTTDDYKLWDMDTPEHYANLKAYFE